MSTDKFVPLGSKVLVSVALILFGFTGCKKDVQETPAQTIVIYGDTIGLPPDAVADVDGNVYRTVVIGSHRWMTTNLRTAHYRNGDVIPYVADNTAWSVLLTGAWSNYGGDAAYDQVTGKLYNWYTVIDPREVCPVGWHVATDDEWKDLELALGMPSSEVDIMGLRGVGTNVGGQMKDSSMWEDPNTGAAAGSELKALPGGARTLYGQYSGVNDQGFWWTATEQDSSYARVRRLVYDTSGIYRAVYPKGVGYSLRCVKD